MKDENRNISNSQWYLYVTIFILVVASTIFRLLLDTKLEQTTLLFIGIPAVISILAVRYYKTSQKPYVKMVRVITLFLLLTSILFGEGVVCILFSSPLFYGVGFLVVYLNGLYKSRSKKDKALSLALVPVLVLLAQPQDLFESPKWREVATYKEYSHRVSWEALLQQPNFQEDLPNFFHIGFPMPIDIVGEGINEGATRDIRFYSKTRGMGTLSLKIEKKTDEALWFSVVSDDTHIAHWMSWKQVRLSLEPLENGGTGVRWTSAYTCDLGPKWYFEFWEDYAVGLSNEHLMDAYFGN